MATRRTSSPSPTRSRRRWRLPPAGGGAIVTDGGRFGGYGAYLLKGKPVFTYNILAIAKFRWEGQEPLTPGKHTLEFDFKYDGPGFAKAAPAAY